MDFSIPSASVPITKQKRTKSYDSFPNQKSVDSHDNSKSSIVCTNCFSTICKPIRISHNEILVYWTYQEWENSVRLPFWDTPRPFLTSITGIRILLPLHSVTHVSHRLLTFERDIPYILSPYNHISCYSCFIILWRKNIHSVFRWLALNSNTTPHFCHISYSAIRF